MLWFRKQHKRKKEQLAVIGKLERDISIDIKLDKDATEEAITKANAVAQSFNELVRQNGFTVKIEAAMRPGGKK